ncbi:hypothetical protein EDB84DRAFT_316924 [Lactarius hengduanensis]|nr:hypothetical protein EDB84DRAFT_316924 [Lactarius hengduanensis]
MSLLRIFWQSIYRPALFSLFPEESTRRGIRSFYSQFGALLPIPYFPQAIGFFRMPGTTCRYYPMLTWSVNDAYTTRGYSSDQRPGTWTPQTTHGRRGQPFASHAGRRFKSVLSFVVAWFNRVLNLIEPIISPSAKIDYSEFYLLLFLRARSSASGYCLFFLYVPETLEAFRRHYREPHSSVVLVVKQPCERLGSTFTDFSMAPWKMPPRIPYPHDFPCYRRWLHEIPRNKHARSHSWTLGIGAADCDCVLIAASMSRPAQVLNSCNNLTRIMERSIASGGCAVECENSELLRYA